MATFVGLHNRVHLAHLDLSGKANQVTFGQLTRVMQPCTTYNDGGYTILAPGLISGVAGINGYQDWSADVLDDEISVGQLGSSYAFTVAPNPTGTVAAGDPAWMSRGVLDRLNPMAGVKGDMAGFEQSLAYDTAVVQAKILTPKAAFTADGNGTAVAMTGPTAAQKLYGALHVFAYSGFTNVVVKIQSDDNSGFASPTDRITFSAVTATANEFASVAGAFSSETHVRTVVDVTGTGSITLAVAAGVV